MYNHFKSDPPQLRHNISVPHKMYQQHNAMYVCGIKAYSQRQNEMNWTCSEYKMNQTELYWTDIVFDELTNVHSLNEFKQWTLYTQLNSRDAVCTRLNGCVCLSVRLCAVTWRHRWGLYPKMTTSLRHPVCDVTSSNVIAHTHTRDFCVYVRTAIIAINITKKNFS